MSNGIIKENNSIYVEKFANIAGNKGAVWLDSTLSFEDRGQQSFIADQPVSEIILNNDGTIFNNGNQEIGGDINLIWLELEKAINKGLIAVGFISYEASLSFLGVKSKANLLNYPLAHFFIYDKIKRLEPTKTNDNSSLPNNELSASEFAPIISKEQFINSILKIKDHIKEGDIYQANFTTRFDIKSNQTPFVTYQNLRKLNPAPYGGYINFGDYQIISSSPERMFHYNHNRIKSAPIKGTIKRGSSPDEQQNNLNHLLNSAKDKAELLMIVDLVRNDLGKIAQAGTVKVESLFKPELYSSLIHLVSDISAKLKEEVSFKDIIRALLPGGSITGAPKKRAVEILEEVETVPRGVYTGCIGILSKDNADFNIAIRTMVHQNGQYLIHAGGGIVADSDPEAEYDEMRLKAKNLLRAVGR